MTVVTAQPYQPRPYDRVATGLPPQHDRRVPVAHRQVDLVAALTTSPERHHHVFLAACGCPFGLVEATWRSLSEDAAWASMYHGRRRTIREARARGVRVVHVDHATYVRELCDLMTGACPHAQPAGRFPAVKAGGRLAVPR